MSFFKKMLSSVGIGSAKVDTILEKDTFRQGEVTDAVVKIKGGNTEQKIDNLYLSINCTYQCMCEVEKTDEDGEVEVAEQEVTKAAVLQKMQLNQQFVIQPGEEKEIEFAFTIPHEAPITVGSTSVWIHTGLDIPKSLDPGDRDDIKVLPDTRVEALFETLANLGFKLVQIECEEKSEGLITHLPFIQELEFKPHDGPFKGRIKEIELVCLPDRESVEVLVEIDRKARGIGSWMAELIDADETHARFEFTENDLPGLDEKFREFLEDIL